MSHVCLEYPHVRLRLWLRCDLVVARQQHPRRSSLVSGRLRIPPAAGLGGSDPKSVATKLSLTWLAYTVTLAPASSRQVYNWVSYGMGV